MIIFVTSLILLFLTYHVIRHVLMKRKLWWVTTTPSYPLVGNAMDFSDSTKSLNAFDRYCRQYNGLCYVELLFRPMILISDHEVIDWLLSSTTVLTKAPDYNALYGWLEGGMLISDGPLWKKARKILTPAFHFAILEKFADVFHEPTTVLINKLASKVGNQEVELDLQPIITMYTLDIICQTSMGVQMNIQEGSQKEYCEAVDGMCKIVVERAFNPLKMFKWSYYLSSDYQREKKFIGILHNVSNTVINKRREELKNEENDKVEDGIGRKRKMAFLDILLNYRDEDGQPLPQSFIRSEVDTFMFAGHDTTATAICFALYCLARSSDVQTKAYQEVKEILGDRTRLTYRDIQDMKYMDLVCKETLRMFPPVPFYSRFMTDDVVYKPGKIFPKGATLVIAAYTINRDPEVYDQPNKFIPERFATMERKPFSYLPFSAGPRNCIGQKFAILEMKSAIASVLSSFELSSVPEHEPVLAAETVLKSKNGLHIRLRKRV